MRPRSTRQRSLRHRGAEFGATAEDGGRLTAHAGHSRNEWEQFQHARIKNGQLLSFEPYELFRHEVLKVVEPEITWQATGVPAPEKLNWRKDENVCGQLAIKAAIRKQFPVLVFPLVFAALIAS